MTTMLMRPCDEKGRGEKEMGAVGRHLRRDGCGSLGGRGGGRADIEKSSSGHL